jgi:short subunit dehydrogenase-like uncharacterized protein
MPDFLLYGPTGYTGELIARAAVAGGLRPRLAGRDPARLRRQTGELHLQYVVAPLDDPAALDAALAGLPLVLHCAGPFRTTHRPMVDACLRNGAHYLDLAGEIGVVEALATRSAEAQAAGVVLLPGVGFDFVPTDCLANQLLARLPDATHVSVAVQHLPWRDAAGRLHQPTASHGTLATLFDSQLASGVVRRDGRLVREPLAARARRVDLGAGPVLVTSFPLGEVATLHHSTGVPNVDAYVALPFAARAALRYLGPVLGRLPARRFLPRTGPSRDELAHGRSLVWVELRAPDGRAETARLETENPYAFTVKSALAAIQRFFDSPPASGFHTPAALASTFDALMR